MPTFRPMFLSAQISWTSAGEQRGTLKVAYFFYHHFCRMVQIIELDAVFLASSGEWWRPKLAIKTVTEPLQHVWWPVYAGVQKNKAEAATQGAHRLHRSEHDRLKSMAEPVQSTDPMEEVRWFSAGGKGFGVFCAHRCTISSHTSTALFA